jgi:diguanylate cyclase (GGDEF)-like protein
LIECLTDELTKATTRASKLEINLSETSRELDSIRESLSRAEQRANTDTLTGLPNRRAFDDFLRTGQVAAMETGAPLSVLLIDIDHFKQFNDRFGHAVGDQVLRLMAGTLRERVREQDLPARYGGEELIAVLPGADLAVCEAVAERIRRSVAECQISRRSTGELLPNITVRLGLTVQAGPRGAERRVPSVLPAIAEELDDVIGGSGLHDSLRDEPIRARIGGKPYEIDRPVEDVVFSEQVDEIGLQATWRPVDQRGRNCIALWWPIDAFTQLLRRPRDSCCIRRFMTRGFVSATKSDALH